MLATLDSLHVDFSDGGRHTAFPHSFSPPASPPSPVLMVSGQSQQSTAEIILDALKPHPRALHVGHANVQSLVAHFHEFKEIVSTLEFHAILISESWLKPTLPSSIVDIDQYTLLRNDRTGRGAGGVCAYIRQDLKPKIISASNSQYSKRPEYMFIEVTTMSQKCLLCVVYKPPKIGFLEDVESVLLPLLTHYQHVIMLGDFNVNLLNDSASETVQLQTIFSSCNMHILPLSATHHTAKSHTLIDLMITNNPNKILIHGQTSAPGLSGHDFIYLAYSLRCPKAKHRFISYRDFKNFDSNKFTIDASNTPWHLIQTIDDIDNKVKLLNELLIVLYNKHAPWRVARVKRPPAPWLTDDIKRMMRERDCAHRFFKKHPTETNFTKYKQLRNKTKQTIRNARLRHAHEILGVNSTPASMWKAVKEYGIGKQKCNCNVNIDLNKLNEHFTSSSLTIDPLKKQSYLANNYLATPPDREKFYMPFVHDAQTRQAIMRLKSKAKGVDELEIQLFKKIIDILVPYITHIFNYSLMTGTYPTLWKSAIVRPIPKKASPSLSSDYRPISILPALSKALEHIVHNHISAYLANHDLLNRYQSGFRRNHSTCTALTKITDDVREAMDKRQATILVLLDFSHAFDSVDIDILLDTLKYLHFSDSALLWLSSYLRDRQQCVYDNDGNSSTWRSKDTGVPQGSILGPLLFSLYINTISSSLTYCRYHLYADDLQLYIHDTPTKLSEAIEHINYDLKSLCDWCDNVGLQINPTKSQAILIAYPKLYNSINKLSLPSIRLNEEVISFSPTVKNLGITMDEHLTWSANTISICKKVFSALHSLRKFKNFFTFNLKLRLVQALVLPYFDYCDVVYLDLGPDLAKKLQRAQNACVRYICNLRLSDHVSPSFSQLSWLRLEQRRSHHSLCLLYRILSQGTPSYLASNFQHLSSHHDRGTRAQTDTQLAIPLHRTSIYTRSFTVSAARSWNLLPTAVRGSQSVVSFRKSCLQFFVNM